jgi:hypothetical protein
MDGGDHDEVEDPHLARIADMKKQRRAREESEARARSESRAISLSSSSTKGHVDSLDEAQRGNDDSDYQDSPCDPKKNRINARERKNSTSSTSGDDSFEKARHDGYRRSSLNSDTISDGSGEIPNS